MPPISWARWKKWAKVSRTIAATGRATIAPRIPASAKPIAMTTRTVAPPKLIICPWKAGTRTEPSKLKARK